MATIKKRYINNYGMTGGILKLSSFKELNEMMWEFDSRICLT